jgi:hypothetical protein
MKHLLLLMPGLLALAPLLHAQNDSLNVRTVGSWPYAYVNTAVPCSLNGQQLTVLFCGDGMMTLNIDTPSSPYYLGEVPIGPRGLHTYVPPNVKIIDRYVYEPRRSFGLSIIDINVPTNPVLCSTTTPPGPIDDIAVSGSYLYAAGDSFGIKIYEISDPYNPVEIGSVPGVTCAWSLAIRDSILFACCDRAAWGGMNYMASFSIGDSGSLTRLDSLPGIQGYRLVQDGNRVYSSEAGSFYVVDISDPANLSLLGHRFCGVLGFSISDTLAYIADGFDGVEIYSVADPANVRFISKISTSNYARDVRSWGDTIYIADDWGGMSLVDATNPLNANFTSTVFSPAAKNNPVAINGHLYQSSGDLYILNAANPSDLTTQGWAKLPGNAIAVAVRDTVEYVVVTGFGLAAYDVSNPGSPALLDTLRLGSNYTNNGWGIALVDTFAIVTGRESLFVANIARPGDLQRVGQCRVPGKIKRVACTGRYAYVAAGDTGLAVVDLADPANPTPSGSVSTGWVWSLAQRDTLLYLANDANGLRIMSTADPLHPATVGICNTPGMACEVAVDSSFAYVADDTCGLRVINVRDPANPVEVGHYRKQWTSYFDQCCGAAVSDGVIYVSYNRFGTQVYQYFGPSGVNGISNDNLRVASTLRQNWPNPFTSSTAISYQLSTSSPVTLTMYNITGQKVRVLVDGRQLAGAHTVSWNGRNDAGRALTAGVYFVRLSANGTALTNKVIKIK